MVRGVRTGDGRMMVQLHYQKAPSFRRRKGQGARKDLRWEKFGSEEEQNTENTSSSQVEKDHVGMDGLWGRELQNIRTVTLGPMTESARDD